MFVKEPKDIYITNVTPNDGKARSIADEILTCKIDLNSKDFIKDFLCDGTPVNTGKAGGVIKIIEIYLYIYSFFKNLNL